MARTRRIKRDGDAYYHLMSRTNDRRFLFEKGSVKTELVSTLRRCAAFCGIEINAYVAMSNHFHIVVKVMKPEKPVGTDELLRRVGILKGEKAKSELAEHWCDLISAGFEVILQGEQERLCKRMHDISEFIKLFKEEFDRIYKRERKYCGSIWSGRFMSTLIQDGEYLDRCKRYVIYNPVRAGLVSQAKDYFWGWCESCGKVAVSLGPVPDEWCLSKVVQIGAGRIFGSVEFVMSEEYSLGGFFKSGSGPHPVGDLGYSTHGWRLAKAKIRMISE